MHCNYVDLLWELQLHVKKLCQSFQSFEKLISQKLSLYIYSVLYSVLYCKWFSVGLPSDQPQHDLDGEVDDLHGADEGEASEEAHGPSNGGQLVHKLGCSILENIKWYNCK